MSAAISSDRPGGGPPAPAAPEGLVLGRLLGSGGWGTVYEARLARDLPWGRSGERVAVKFLRSDRFGDPAALGRFLREGHLSRRIEHPGVVRVLAAGGEPGPGGPQPYLVLEFVEGRTFGRLIRELGRVPEALLRELALQVADALAAVHAAGIVHRDLKPSNILITPDHTVKVMDLGIAALLDDGERLTATGMFVGTLDYAAPEQLSGAPLTPVSDLYALGVVLHEAASGQRFFDAPSTRAVVARHLHERPARLGELLPQVSPFFEEVVANLLEKAPADRFAGAAELAEALRQGESSRWWRERDARRTREAERAPWTRVRVQRDTPFTDRVAEMRQLQAWVEEARQGRGRVVLLEGEAGAGKSRFLDELLRRVSAAAPETRILFGSDSPGARRGAGALARGLVDALGEAQLEARLSELLGGLGVWAPSLAALLTGLPSPPGAPSLDGEALPALLHAVVTALTREQPCVWVVEDLHFAGADGRALFRALAERSADLPLLLIGTARTGFAPEELGQVARLPHASRLPLPRLSQSDVVAMITDVGDELGAAAAVELRRQILAKADGNPFFVSEMLREIRRRRERTRTLPAPGGESASSERPSSSSRAERIEIPASVRELLEGRLGGLEDEDRKLLDLAAVEGYEFDPELLATVRKQGMLEVLERLAQIERRTGLIAATGAGFRFDHHLMQEFLYEGLPPVLRRAYHRALAAAHRAAGTDGRVAARRDGATAVEHELRGGFLPAEPELLAVLDRLAAAYETDRVLDLIGFALQLVPPGRPELRAALRLREADRLFLQHRIEEHRVAVTDALAAAEEAGDQPARARALFERGRVLVDAGAAEARPVLEQALDAARAAGDLALEARSEGALGHVELRAGDFPAAHSRYGRQASLAAQAGDVESAAEAGYYLGESLLGLSRFSEARDVLDRAVAKCRRHGFRRVEARATADLALAAFALGLYPEARANYLRAIELAEELGYREGAALGHGNFALLAMLEGDLGEAAEHNSAHLELALAIESAFLATYAGLYRGELRRLQGDAAAAEADYRAALADFRGFGFQLGVLESLFFLGRLLCETGRREEAIELLREAEQVATDHELRDPAPLPTLYLALLGDRPVEGLDVPPTLQLPLAVEAHWVLAQAGAGEHHARRASELAHRISGHLRGAALSRFWTHHPVARACAAADRRDA